MGFRSMEAALRLVAGNFVKPAYGRKGHLKALFLKQADGSNPIQQRMPSGTRYSYLQNLNNGARCWALRKLDRRDEDGVPFSTRGVFLQVIQDCIVG